MRATGADSLHAVKEINHTKSGWQPGFYGNQDDLYFLSVVAKKSVVRFQASAASAAR